MEHKEAERLIYRILATENEELACEQVFELIARYVDLEVSDEDARRLMPLVYQHLVQCDMCADLHDIVRELAMMEKQDALPDVDDLLEGILEAGRSPAGNRAAPTPAPLPRVSSPPRELTRSPGWLPRWANLGWAAAAVAVVVAVGLGTWGWNQATRLRSQEAFIAQADRAIALRGTEQDPDAQGYLFVRDADGRTLLVINGLNPLTADQVYQVWIITDAGTLSAGTFTVGPDQRGRVYLTLAPDAVGFTSLAITLEPKGGSPEPTGSPVCVWGKQL